MIKASTGIFCLLAVLLVTPAVAQSGPTIRLVSPSTAGGGSDTLARLLADQISRKQGRTVVVENRPGAGHRPASHAAVAKAVSASAGFPRLRAVGHQGRLAGFMVVLVDDEVAVIGDVIGEKRT